MRFLWEPGSTLRPLVLPWLPLALWVLVWSGIQAGYIEDLFKSGDLVILFSRFRGALPLAAAIAAAVVLAVNLSGGRSGKAPLYGGLGLASLYGLVGVLASTQSPDGSTALYWAVLYLSVPLVLLAAASRADGAAAITRIIHFNWLVIVVAVVVLFTMALLYLDLGTFILSPSSWLECPLYRAWRGESWDNLTSGFLRPTGVGRYAAVAALMALGGLWQSRWRYLWGAILLASLILLLSSGARAALIGFAGAAPVIILLHGGKKAAIGGVLVLLALAPVAWATSYENRFLDNCIYRASPAVTRETTAPGPSSAEVVAPETTAPGPSSAGVVTPDPTAPGPSSAGVVTPDTTAPGPSSAAVVTPEPTAPGPSSAGVVTPEPTAPGPSSAGVVTPEPTAPGPSSAAVVTPEPTAPGPSPVEDRASLGFPLRLDRTITTSGRTPVWSAGLELFTERPMLGYGFHADRLLLGTHMHNAFLQALLQTGIVGVIPFLGAVLLGAAWLFWTLLHRALLPEADRHLLILASGLLVFFLLRSIPESTGAFFGVDWILVAPLLLYPQVIAIRAGRTHQGRG